MNQFKDILGFILKSVIAGLALAFVLLWWQRHESFQPAASGTSKSVRTATQSAAQAPFSYADAVAKVSPSVVSIYATTTLTRHRSDELSRGQKRQ